MLAVREDNHTFPMIKPLWGDPWTAALSASYETPPIKERFSGRCDDVVDGNDIVAEINGGVVTATYLRGLNIDEAFVRQASSGDEHYLTDGLGSTIALTNDAGTVTTRYSYDPFGNTTVIGTSTNVFQYSGRENDGMGLYYLRARYYSPKMQRFISEDPLNIQQLRLSIQKNNTRGLPAYYVMRSRLHHPELLHQYNYVANNPMTRIDPRGLDYITVSVGPVNINMGNGSASVTLTPGVGLAVTANPGNVPSTSVGVQATGTVGVGLVGGNVTGSLTGDINVTQQEGPYGPGADVTLDINGDASWSIGLSNDGLKPVGLHGSGGPFITLCLFGPKC